MVSVVLVGDAVVDWRGTEAETDTLLKVVHAYATCVGLDCCELGDTEWISDCSAHAMLSSQVALDMMLALMRGGEIAA